MKTSVEILFDKDREMYQININGECISEGNYWDLSVTDLPDLFTSLGLDVKEGSYEYADEDFLEQLEWQKHQEESYE